MFILFYSELHVLKSRGLPPSTLLRIDLPAEVSGYKAVFLRLWAREEARLLISAHIQCDPSNYVLECAWISCLWHVLRIFL